MLHPSCQPSMTASKNKSIKQDSDSLTDYFSRKRYGDKIKAMYKICKYQPHHETNRPLIYQKIRRQNDPRLISRVSLKGYKYLSRVVASGEYTTDILNQISQTSCLKLVRHLDFDPYFCQKSGLGPLSKVLKKLRRLLYHLTLILRRFTQKDELKKFSSFLGRSTRMTKIKIEFADPQDIDKQDVRYLVKSFKKLHLIKSADISLSGSKDVDKNLDKLQGMFEHSYRMEELRLQVYFCHREPYFLHDTPKKKRIVFHKNLKFISLKFSFKTGWETYFDGLEFGLGFQVLLQILPRVANPTYFSLTFDKLQMSLDILEELAGLFPRLTNLKFVCIELNNIKLTEFDIMVLAKGFMSCKGIEHFTFKYLDNVIIPMADILQFIIIMAKHSTFQKFDLFFRKILYEEWDSHEVRSQLDQLENINYFLTKQSIHIQSRV